MPWSPLTHQAVTAEVEKVGVDHLILIANSVGDTFSGRLARIGGQTVEIVNGPSTHTFYYGNRAYQFQVLKYPPRRIFKAMEKDLFSYVTPPDLRDSESRE